MPSPIRRLLAFYALQLRLVRTWRLGRRALVRRVILTTVVAYLAFGATVALVPGITVSADQTILFAVFAIALLNALVRPVILAIALPLGIVAVWILGTAFQVVVVVAVGTLVPGLHVRDLTAAIEGAVLFAAINTAISWFVALGEDESYFSHLVRLLIRDHAAVPKTDKPGVVFVQIDGLSHPVLVQQVRAGRAPTMSRWLRSRRHRLLGWRCQLPSQTSASQAGILLGSNDGIPAFRWFEKSTGRLMVSNRPADAAEIERRLSNGDGLLSGGGSSIGNLVSGGATESVLTMSRFSDARSALGPTRSWFYFLVSPFSMARALFLTIGEAGKEVWQARRQSIAGMEPRIARGGVFPLLRAATNVFLRQVSVALVVERMLEGVPLIYVDFVDYDEIAHHAGPERGESLDALDGIDRVLGALERVALECPRPYSFVVLSDHGQSQGATFRQRYGVTLEQLIHGLMGGEAEVTAATASVEAWGPLNLFLSEVARGQGVGARLTGRALGRRMREGAVELGPGRGVERRHFPAATGPTRRRGPTQEPPEGGRSPTEEPPELVVCASGNLALVHLNRQPERLTLEQVAEEYPGLVEGLARHEGIGFVLVHSARFGAVALGPAGCNFLDERRIEGEDPLEPFGPGAEDDLRRLDAMSNVGDLVLNSRLDPDTKEVAAFEELVGSHGGIGGWQMDAFLLYPADWHEPSAPIVGAPAVHAQLVEWLVAAGIRSDRNEGVPVDERLAEQSPA